MENDPRFSGLVDPVDRDCLSHLVDLDIKHDDTDGRNVTISLVSNSLLDTDASSRECQHFDQDNPYFSERTLTKKMTVTAAALADDVAKYDVDAPLESTPVTITWSSPDHDLTKKKPRIDLDELEDGDEFEGSIGSFFNWFGETEDRVSASEMVIELHAGAVESVPLPLLAALALG